MFINFCNILFFFSFFNPLADCFSNLKTIKKTENSACKLRGTDCVRWIVTRTKLISKFKQRLSDSSPDFVYALLIILFFIPTYKVPVLIALPVTPVYTECKTIIFQHINISPPCWHQVTLKIGENITSWKTTQYSLQRRTNNLNNRMLAQYFSLIYKIWHSIVVEICSYIMFIIFDVWCDDRNVTISVVLFLYQLVYLSCHKLDFWPPVGRWNNANVTCRRHFGCFQLECALLDMSKLRTRRESNCLIEDCRLGQSKFIFFY